MTEQEIENTKVIAEFMGIEKYCIERNGVIEHMGWVGFSGDVDALKYYNSYDWLFPVWVKFRDLKNIDKIKFFNLWHSVEKERIKIFLTESNTPKNAFTALAEAIKWYYEN